MDISGTFPIRAITTALFALIDEKMLPESGEPRFDRGDPEAALSHRHVTSRPIDDAAIEFAIARFREIFFRRRILAITRSFR